MFCVWRTAIAVAVFISAPQLLEKKNEDKKNTVTVLTVWWCMVLVGQVDLIEENRERLSFNYDL
jgi:hypothetical protein